MANEIRIVDSISSRLSSAATLFARHAIEIESLNPYDASKGWSLGNTTSSDHHRVMEYTIGAVVMSCAYIEAVVNEVIEDAREARRRRSIFSIPVGLGSFFERHSWPGLSSTEIPEKVSVIEKIQTVLSLAGVAPLPEESGSMQQLKALQSLRNELVHAKPVARRHGKNVGQKKKDALEKLLQGKFSLCAMVSENEPFIWRRCLGAGCAKWAVNTASAVFNDISRSLRWNVTHGFID